MAYMKFNRISYETLVQNAIMTAQFVQELPVLLSDALDVNTNDVIILSITHGDESPTKKRSTAEQGVLVSLAVPETEIEQLGTIISNKSSSLYSSSNGQLPSFIDSSYPITGTTGNSYSISVFTCLTLNL